MAARLVSPGSDSLHARAVTLSRPEANLAGMEPELIVLVFGAGVVIGVAAGTAMEKIRSQTRRDAWRARNYWRLKESSGNRIGSSPPLPPVVGPKVPDAADQLRIVMGATFTIQPLLNKKEARVFKELDRIVVNRNPAWQVMAQVSLGEILRSKDAEAYSCINSKRVDLLLVDGDCQPRHVIEYQGMGHHNGAAAARDAVKKEALRRAGIGYHEVIGGHTTPTELRRLVERLVVQRHDGL
jgi:hypothetical protein